MARADHSPAIRRHSRVLSDGDKGHREEMATEKQINYALALLDKAGYSTRFMDASFKALGATMRERSGSVTNWLKNKNAAEVSKLIDALKGKG